MTGMLVYREVVLPNTATVSGIVARDTPQEMWLGIFMGEDQRVGFVHWTAEPVMRDSGAGTGLRVMASLRMELLSRPTELNITGHAWRRNTGGLADFNFTMSSGDHKMRAEGILEDGTLDAELHTGGTVTPFSVPVDDTLLFSGGMGMPGLDLPSLEPGEEVFVDSFNPASMSVEKTRVTCTGIEEMDYLGETVQAYVLETTVGGITTRAWATEDERLVRAETAFGFVMKPVTPEEALRPVDAGAQSDLIQSLKVSPTGEQPVRDARRMKIRVTGLSEDRMPPSEPYQTREADGVYNLTIPAAPPPGAGIGTLEDADQYLGKDASGDPADEKIRTAAADAIGNADTPWATATALYEWVYNEIDKVNIIAIPTAAEVLRTKQGDCNEHTVLFTAMARSLEIPTRIAIGLVYSDEIDGFGYHAWPEVYIDNRWIPMDPTLGQPIADATHIKLLNGSIGEWAQLVHYIGQIKVEVLEVE
jgi:hypothetical protein